MLRLIQQIKYPKWTRFMKLQQDFKKSACHQLIHLSIACYGETEPKMERQSMFICSQSTYSHIKQFFT